MSLRRKLVALDSMFPPCGPCAFCGGPDKRHRFWDALETSVRLDGLERAVKNHMVPESEALLVADAYAHARRLHRRLPGGYPLPVAH